jgi:hypothetical protein
MDMKRFKILTLSLLLFSLVVTQAAAAQAVGNTTAAATTISPAAQTLSKAGNGVLDFNEVIHLVFLREAEKLERDVFTILSSMYPDSQLFGRIDDIEQGHADVMKYLLKQYGVKDPNVNDNLGVFTGELYGNFFSSTYRYLVGLGSLSELDAFYVSAYIEETNLLDIMQCPDAIVSQDNGIDDVSQCGMGYTHNVEIINVYHALIEGSKSDLRAYVQAIESVIGEGAYKAQAMSQQQLDEILGRDAHQ